MSYDADRGLPPGPQPAAPAAPAADPATAAVRAQVAALIASVEVLASSLRGAGYPDAACQLEAAAAVSRHDLAARR